MRKVNCGRLMTDDEYLTWLEEMGWDVSSVRDELVCPLVVWGEDYNYSGCGLRYGYTTDKRHVVKDGRLSTIDAITNGNGMPVTAVRRHAYAGNGEGYSYESEWTI